MSPWYSKMATGQDFVTNANWAMEDQDQQINRLGKCNAETKKNHKITHNVKECKVEGANII